MLWLGQHASDKMKSDADVAAVALQQSGMVLQFVADTLRANRDLVYRPRRSFVGIADGISGACAGIGAITAGGETVRMVHGALPKAHGLHIGSVHTPAHLRHERPRRWMSRASRDGRSTRLRARFRVTHRASPMDRSVPSV